MRITEEQTDGKVVPIAECSISLRNARLNLCHF